MATWPHPVVSIGLFDIFLTYKLQTVASKLQPSVASCKSGELLLQKKHI
jgi:hypothetical protein